MPESERRRRKRLVEALRYLTPVMRRKLARLKSEGRATRRRPDLLWHLLVNCAATQGNARGWERLFASGQLPADISYDTLRKQTPARRERSLERALRDASVRWPNRKAKWLAVNFARLEQEGGVRAATRHALALAGCDAKIRFVRQFQGIGPKYANNLWMDLYDPDFRDCVAVDVRLTSVLRELGVGKSVDALQYFRKLAKDANLQPWEVDRLLFWFTDYFLAAIRY